MKALPVDEATTSTRRLRKRSIGYGVLLTIGLLVNVLLITVINAPSLLAFFYFLFISLILYFWLVGRNLVEAALLYSFYALLVITLFLVQHWTYPDYFGFSGGPYIGTDDSDYYTHVADELPHSFPVRERPVRNYELLMRFITWYPVTHPFDILFFNVLPLVLIPPFTFRLALVLTYKREVSRLAYKLVLFCPFLLANSLVLIRDGWTAMCLLGSTLFFLRQQYFKVSVLLAFLAALRMGSALVLVIILGCYVCWRFIDTRGVSRKILFMGGATAVATIALLLLYPMILSYLESKGFLNTFFFRQYFVGRYLLQNPNTSLVGDSIMVSIYQQNPLVRIPLGFLYFFMSPWFVPNWIIREGIFVPRMLMQNIFALLFIFYFKYLIQAIVHIWFSSDKKMLFTLLAYLVAILALSQASLQIRHKVMLLPLMYILVAYGYYHRTKVGVTLGTTGAVSSAVIQFVRMLLRLG